MIPSCHTYKNAGLVDPNALTNRCNLLNGGGYLLILNNERSVLNIPDK